MQSRFCAHSFGWCGSSPTWRCRRVLLPEGPALVAQLVENDSWRLLDVSPGFPVSFDAHHELRELSKVAQFFALVFVIGAARGRQDVNARAIKQLFLDAVVTLALRELFIGKLAVESHNARGVFLQLLRKHDA